MAMDKTFTSNSEALFRNMLTAADGGAGEVIELKDWKIPIERAAQVIEAFVTDKQKYVNALALVSDIANRYHIDVVASQYVRLFESSRDEHRLRSRDNRN